jgi:hypothetical protein
MARLNRPSDSAYTYDYAQYPPGRGLPAPEIKSGYFWPCSCATWSRIEESLAAARQYRPSPAAPNEAVSCCCNAAGLGSGRSQPRRRPRLRCYRALRRLQSGVMSADGRGGPSTVSDRVTRGSANQASGSRTGGGFSWRSRGEQRRVIVEIIVHAAVVVHVDILARRGAAIGRV